MRRNPDGHFDLVAHDPRIIWPDALFATDTHLYVTLGQWNRLPGFNNGLDLRRPPYLVVKGQDGFPNEEKQSLSSVLLFHSMRLCHQVFF